MLDIKKGNASFFTSFLSSDSSKSIFYLPTILLKNNNSCREQKFQLVRQFFVKRPLKIIYLPFNKVEVQPEIQQSPLECLSHKINILNIGRNTGEN